MKVKEKDLKEKDLYNLEVILEEEDKETLKSGRAVEFKHENTNLYVYLVSDLDSRTNKENGYIEINLITNNIGIYLPSEIAKNDRIAASFFSSRLGNIYFVPETFRDRTDTSNAIIRLVYIDYKTSENIDKTYSK